MQTMLCVTLCDSIKAVGVAISHYHQNTDHSDMYTNFRICVFAKKMPVNMMHTLCLLLWTTAHLKWTEAK